jgi:peroxiredoxin
LPLLAEDEPAPEVNLVVAPPFDLLDPQGKHHQLKDYRGRVVIVNFWASWCVPCRRELPSMNRAWAKLKPKGVVMLAINLGEEVEAVQAFLKDFPIDFPVLLDRQGRTSQEWRVRGLPTTFVLNPQGEIAYREIGEREWDAAALLHKVLTLSPGG